MRNRNLKYMVLGSSSFAGGSFIDLALRSGISVIGVSRSRNKNQLCIPYFNNLNKYLFEEYILDLNKDFDKLIELISFKKPEIIIDFAGQGMVAPSWEYPEQWYQTNVLAKSKLINSIKSSAFLEKYIRISTPEVYGSTDEKVIEGSLINPSTPYAISHAAIDMHLQAYFREYDFPMIIGRFANFYGSCQQLYRVIPKLFYSSLTGGIFYLEGGGNSERSFLHRDDFSSGIMSMVESGKVGQIYHFSNDKFISIFELTQKICQLTDANFSDIVRITKDRRGKDFSYMMSSEFSRKELNWKPKISLDVGLNETFEWVRKNLILFKNETFSYEHKE